MSHRVKAIYRRGAFIPKTPCDLPEEAELDLIIEGPYMLPPQEPDPEKRRRILKELVESMRRNPIPADAPRFTREELHERR